METQEKSLTVVHWFVHYMDDIGRPKTAGPYPTEKAAKEFGDGLQRMYVTTSDDGHKNTHQYGKNL